MKKILLGLGTITIIAIPVVSVIACADVNGTLEESIKRANAEQAVVNTLHLTSATDLITGFNRFPAGIVGFVEKKGSRYEYTTTAPATASVNSGDKSGTITINVFGGPVPSTVSAIAIQVYRA